MLPAPLTAGADAYLRELDRIVADRVAAVYLVGSPALEDFSPRQSNIDLVVVTETDLTGPEAPALRRAEAGLSRAGRPASVWYTTWRALAEDAPAGQGIDTPLTRAILRGDAMALYGPDWPVVRYDDAEFRQWCRQQLAEVAVQARGLMLMRHTVGPLVLEAARLAVGAREGRVLSKSEAGVAAAALVPPHFRRILSDATGYRQGANTSMYWGPFERKYDARQLVKALSET